MPAGEWKGKLIPGIGEWIMDWANIPRAEYEQFAPRFNPVKFDADTWVKIAQDAGMKYIIITSKHQATIFDFRIHSSGALDPAN